MAMDCALRERKGGCKLNGLQLAAVNGALRQPIWGFEAQESTKQGGSNVIK